MGALLRYYFQNTTFVVLHAIALLGSACVIALWYRYLTQAKQAAVREQPRSTTDIERITSSLKPFDSYFDFCSSVFIFIGLLGTIFGFVAGIPELSKTDYKFGEVLRALSTSAGGIVLSLIFNLITIALDFLLLRPFLADLRSRVKGDALELTIRDHLNRIDQSLLKSMESFETSAILISGSIEAWRGELGSLAKQQSESAKGIAETQASFVATHEALVSLPASIRSELAGVFSDSKKSLSDLLERIRTSLESFEKLPARIESGLDSSFTQRKKAIDEALEKYRAAIESQRTSLDELYSKMKALPMEVAENLRLSTVSALELQKAGHEEFLAKLRGAVRVTVEDQLAQLGAATVRMELSAEHIEEKWAAALSSEKDAVRNAVMAALSETVKIVQQQRENLIKMESTLPEGLAATFQTLIEETKRASATLSSAAQKQVDATESLNKTIASLRDSRLSLGPRDAPRTAAPPPPAQPPNSAVHRPPVNGTPIVSGESDIPANALTVQPAVREANRPSAQPPRETSYTRLADRLMDRLTSWFRLGK